MNTYEIQIKFKNKEGINFEMGTEKDLKKSLSSTWSSKNEDIVLRIGDYFLVKDEILWIKIKGEILEKRSRK